MFPLTFSLSYFNSLMSQIALNVFQKHHAGQLCHQHVFTAGGNRSLSMELVTDGLWI